MNHQGAMISIPTQDMLGEVVRRVVETADPLQIILFGSAARGAVGPNSDLDLLVVMPDGTHRRRTQTAIYRALRGIGLPKDVVVVTERDIEQHGDNPSLLLKPALEEGRQLYASA